MTSSFHHQQTMYYITPCYMYYHLISCKSYHSSSLDMTKFHLLHIMTSYSKVTNEEVERGVVVATGSFVFVSESNLPSLLKV